VTTVTSSPLSPATSAKANTTPGEKTLSRTLRSLVAFAIFAVIGAGCSNSAVQPGNGGSGNTTTTTASSDRDQAVKFAQCMREHGVRNFPDPDASGDFAIDTVANRSGVDTTSATFTQARMACKDLEPSGFTGHKRTPEQQQAALKFAECIRDNGVKDFPDPGPDAPMIDTDLIPSTERSGGMDALHAAMQKCRGLAGDAGVSGGR